MEPNDREELGIVGLGRMGGNLALQAVEKGFRVVGLQRKAVSQELQDAGVVAVSSLAALSHALRRPRKIFLYIPSGTAVDRLIDSVVPSLEKGDIVIDGGNSYWGDSISRFERLKPTGIDFVDLGTSGGISGARHGACFMAGGEPDAIRLLEPILKRLAVQDGYLHAGPPGAGHFTKLCHNGIEFGMLQAISEGVDLLAHHKDKLDIAAVLHCWRNGSVIRSWLIDLMEDALRQVRREGGLSRVPGYVDDTGEVNWLVADAMRMEVPIPVIAQSVMQLFLSRDGDEDAKAVAMMRHGFGGHAYGPNKAAYNERTGGRVEEMSSERPPNEATP
ncbi:MAG: phosphogluconate dehydrogenase (NAD(+)-dependent, decarboxylating) [Polyangiaceae bacterium]|jgi:6-phosphogluconate dehydrogenase